MNLPPVLQLITTEISADKPELSRLQKLLRDKGFINEAARQAEFSVNEEDDSNGRTVPDDTLNVYPSAALNPLSDLGKCNAHNCRMIQAQSFVNSIGLYCDHAVLTDYISHSFLDPKFPVPAEDLYARLQALSVLMPMVRAGIIRFSQPVGGLCPDCCKSIAKEHASKLFQMVLADGMVQFLEEDGTVDCYVSSSLFDSDGRSLLSHYVLTLEEAKRLPLPRRKVKIRSLHKETLRFLKEKLTWSLQRDIVVISQEAISATNNASVLVSNCREDAVILRRLDGGAPTTCFEDWEKLRSVSLPWVSNLSVEEILTLREKAGDALPTFRDRMNKELFKISARGVDHDKLSLQVAKRLREEAHELDAELKVASKKTGHTGHLGLGAAGISCIIYGIGASDAGAINAGTALLAALGAMHHPRKDAHAELSRLKTKPAYVLLSAREIIRNR